MKGISFKSVMFAAALASLVAVPARANTITPAIAVFVPGAAIAYTAELSSGELHSGDGFTIYDIGGFLGVPLIPGWTSSVQASGSAFGAVGLTTADTTLPNVNFTYTGPTLQHALGPRPTFGPFIIATSSILLTTDDWLSRDHLLGSSITIGDGLLSNPIAGQIDVPFGVPDGGSTAALLGSVLVAFGMLRRRLN